MPVTGNTFTACQGPIEQNVTTANTKYKIRSWPSDGSLFTCASKCWVKTVDARCSDCDKERKANASHPLFDERQFAPPASREGKAKRRSRPLSSPLLLPLGQRLCSAHRSDNGGCTGRAAKKRRRSVTQCGSETVQEIRLSGVMGVLPSDRPTYTVDLSMVDGNGTVIERCRLDMTGAV